MTIETGQSSIEYAGTGAETEFSILFPVQDASHLVVTRIAATGEETLLQQGADFSTETRTDGLGPSTVVGVILTEALPAGWRLRIRRKVAFTQENQFHNQGPNNPRVTEYSLDKVTMLCQQLNDDIIGIDERIRELSSAAGTGDDSLHGAYSRNENWSSGRDYITPPADMLVNVGGKTRRLREHESIPLTVRDWWDNPDWANETARAGRDFYIYVYADNGGSSARLVISANSTIPSGVEYTAGNTRKIGGFHCLCADVGTIDGHPLSQMRAGQVLPASVWDLRHRPIAAPEGMVYSDALGKWYQIYPTDNNGRSIYNGIIADAGTGSAINGYPIGSWYWFNELLAVNNMTLLSDAEFQIVARGSNKQTTINDGTVPQFAGGHSDTAGRRMISWLGVEDMCGAVSQWLCDNASVAIGGDGTIWHADTGGNGAHLGTGQAMHAGGMAVYGAYCGPAQRYIFHTKWTGGGGLCGRGCSLPRTV